VYGVCGARGNNPIACDNTVGYDRALVPLMQNRGEWSELYVGMNAGNWNCTM
jgi:hypothetical protein